MTMEPEGASLMKYPLVFNSHKKGKPLTSSAKEIVSNVFCKLRSQNSELSENEVLEMTSNLTGVSTSSILRMKTEFHTFGRFSTPGKKRPLKVGTQTRMKKYDDFTLNAIRRKVHDFFFRNEIPTANKIMETINADDDLPNFSLRTVQYILKDLGFVYSKRNRKSILIEREDIQKWRRQYLRDIINFRKEGRKIYYTDETWVNFGHTRSKVWQDTTIKSAKQAFLAGLSPGLKAPSGKGSRLILIHAGSCDGFVPNAFELFKAKKDGGDYHGEMNGDSYAFWFESKLLPNLEPHSVIVIDNAPYHSVRTETIPNSSSKKAEIQAWLTSKNLLWSQDMLKVELLSIVNNVRKNYESYKIDQIAENYGHKILRLPPYHCELNPIELVWSQVKGYVASKNTTFKYDEVQKLTVEAAELVTPQNWQNYINHTLKVEKNMWDVDNLAEETVEKLCFSVNSDSSECSDLESDSISEA